MMNEWIISSSVLIAAVLLGRRLLKGKISLRLQYALWAVVLLRLLIPFQIFTSDFGAGSIANEVDLSEPVRQVYFAANEEQYEIQYNSNYREMLQRYESKGEQIHPAEVEQQAAEYTRQTLQTNMKSELFMLWLRGMAVMAAVIISCNIHLALRLRRRRRALEVPGSLLPVYVTEAVPTPCVFGLFRPAIYLTPGATRDGQVRTHVLEHELTHYRHFDHVWSALRTLCLVLHWYNPLVWIAAKVSRADAELACDEGALARLGESQRGDYGRTLIGLTCSAPISELLITATTMTGSAGSIRERIKLLMQRPRNSALTVTAVILMVTLMVGCTFASVPETTPPTETTAPTEPGVDNDMSYQGQELPIPDDPSVPLTAAFAGEDLRADHTYRAKESEYLTGIAFTANEALLDIQLGQLQWLEDGSFRMDMLYGIPSLEAGQTLAVYIPFWGDTTTYGIRFTDASGHDRHFSVSLSGMDGSLILDEYDPEWNLTETVIAYALPMTDVMAEYQDLNPRVLTEKELDRFNAAFAPVREDGTANPAACFLYPYYNEISEMDGGEFLAYFPSKADATEEEFRLLQEKYPKIYEFWTWEDLPAPIHRYEAADIEAVVSKWGNIHWQELCGGVQYLEETGCYYNFTSDFALGGFQAIEGFVYDGGAVVYSSVSALFLTETAGSYTIRSHLPQLGLSAPGSHPMIPADPSPLTAVIAAVQEFVQAYQENIWLGTDNKYDHLTILSADPELIVPYPGGTAVLSGFQENIQYLHDKEAYWKHERQDEGILKGTFLVTEGNRTARFEDGIAVVRVDVNTAFYYEDSPGPSGIGTTYEITLVQADGAWLIADVLELNDWFDTDYKNDPDFDVDELIGQ